MVIDWTPDTITAAATVGLTILTLVLAAGSIFLWLSTRRLVLGAEETAERQLRAYVFVESAQLTRHPGGIGGWMAAIKIRNFGDTPAYNVCIKAEKRVCLALPENDLLEFSGNSSTLAQSVIGPGAFSTITIDFSHEIPDDWGQWRPLRVENKKGYIWGRIEYRDAFDKQRFTTFQMIHDFMQIEQFAYCERGNNSEFSLSVG
jgi:hypothetical protein